MSKFITTDRTEFTSTTFIKDSKKNSIISISKAGAHIKDAAVTAALKATKMADKAGKDVIKSWINIARKRCEQDNEVKIVAFGLVVDNSKNVYLLLSTTTRIPLTGPQYAYVYAKGAGGKRPSRPAGSDKSDSGLTTEQIGQKRLLVKQLRRFRERPPYNEAGLQAVRKLKGDFEALDPLGSRVFTEEADRIIEEGKALMAKLEEEQAFSDTLDISVPIEDDSDEDDEAMMAYAEELDPDDESGFLSDMEDDDEDDDEELVVVTGDED